MTRGRGVLLDTGPIYALLDARDQLHAEALALFGRLEGEGTAVSAAYPALLETTGCCSPEPVAT